MNILQNIKLFIDDLDAQQFNRYMYAFLGSLIVCCLLIIINFYRHVYFYDAEIEMLNKERKEVRAILTEYARIDTQRATVKRILEEDPSFKIGGHFSEVLSKLNLPNANIQETSPSELNDKEYREVVLKASFSAMNMKQLCELLQEIEKSKRIYTKELEIAQTKPGSISVQLAIGTLQPKVEAPE